MNIITHADRQAREDFLVIVDDGLGTFIWDTDLFNFNPLRRGIWVDGHELVELLSAKFFVSFPEQLGLIRFNLLA